MKGLRWCVPLFICYLAVFGTAEAATKVNIRDLGGPPLQQWVDNTYQGLPTPDIEIDVYLQPCPTNALAGGCYRMGSKPPTMWLNPQFEPSASKTVFFHELGHAFDDRYLSESDRQALIEMMRYPSTVTEWKKPTPFRASPQEWFAAAASSCWIGPRKDQREYGYTYSYWETVPLCRALAETIAGRHSWHGRLIYPAAYRTAAISDPRRVIDNVAWGGEATHLYFRDGYQVIYGCQGRKRFGDQGVVEINFCGDQLRISKTIPGVVRVKYFGVPRK